MSDLRCDIECPECKHAALEATWIDVPKLKQVRLFCKWCGMYYSIPVSSYFITYPIPGEE